MAEGWSMQDGLEFVVFCAIAAFVVSVVLLGTNEWVRDRREREIYRQTQRRKP